MWASHFCVESDVMPADEADAVLELVLAADGGIADLGAVVVDGIGSVVQRNNFFWLGCFYSMYICKKLLQPHRYYSFFISAR